MRAFFYDIFKAMDSSPDNFDKQENLERPQALTLQASVKTGWHKNEVMWLVVAATLLVAGGVLVGLLLPQQSNEAVSQDTPSHSSSVDQFFYVFGGNKTIDIYDVKTKEKSSRTLTMADVNEYPSSYSQGQTVQFSADGQTMAYSTFNNPTGHPCASYACIQSYSIYVSYGDTYERVVEVVRPEILSGWVIGSDGKTIFYLTSDGQAGMDLHKVKLSDKKDTLLQAAAFGTKGGDGSSMYILNSGALRLYFSDSGVIKQYSYDGDAGESTSFDVSKSCACDGAAPAYGSPLSPDGKTLVLQDYSAPQGHYNYYLLDTASHNIRQVMKLTETINELGSVFWSPDSKSLAYDAAPALDFRNRFEMYDVASEETTAGFVHPSSAADTKASPRNLGLLGWSPDSSMVALGYEDKVKIYSRADGSSIDTGMGISIPIGGASYGWYAR